VSTFDGMWVDLAPVGREPDAAVAAGRPGVVIGSHLDSVPDGGAFDGPLGVVPALAALDLLCARGFSPRQPVGAASFGDEEGAPSGVACAGSRLLTGALAPDRARSLTDDEGTTMAEAMSAAGQDPRVLGRDEDALRRIGTFLELHVEQGSGLVSAENGKGAAVGDAADTAPVEESWTPSTAFDPALRERPAAAVAGPDGTPEPVLRTGAGHDAGILSATGVPTGMLFVRNPTGVSHSPAEHAEQADCLAGVDAIARAIEALT
jgi:acetylornithine deacetylase/succinyl-diaminopimelate desuccinylase-like protein